MSKTLKIYKLINKQNLKLNKKLMQNHEQTSIVIFPKLRKNKRKSTFISLRNGDRSHTINNKTRLQHL